MTEREGVPLAERFFSKVERDGAVPTHRPELGACWRWTGAKNDKGYGVIALGGRSSRTAKAHRVSWELARGALSPEMVILHLCDNPECSRPTHLKLGTVLENNADKVRKGRNVAPRGESNGRARLTAAAVAEMRSVHGPRMGCRRLAARFGVSTSTVLAVLHGRTWRHA